MLTAAEQQTILNLVREAGSLLLNKALARDITVKGRANFVTSCDFAVQEQLKGALAARWPDAGFYSEEQVNQPKPAGPCWVLDPVDGTANLMSGLGQSAISLALLQDGQPVFGAVYNPFTGDLFHAAAGGGAFLGDTPLAVSEVPLADGLVAVGTAPYDRSLAGPNFALFEQLFASCADLRRIGSAALDLAYVAAGRMVGYVERNLKPWDFAAGVLLVQEAGGRVCQFDGTPVNFFENTDMVAAAPASAPGLLAVTAKLPATAALLAKQG